MKIVTWNIQWGLGMTGRVDLPGIVAHARAMSDFDVLCLQEVSANMPDLQGTGGADQFATIASLLPGFRALACAGVDITDEGGEERRFGNMLLTRLPVRQVLRHQLPWFGGEGQNMPRVLLEAVVMAPFGPVRAMTTHLEYSSEALKAAQVEAIRTAHDHACDRERVRRRSGAGPYAAQPGTLSAILTGDFNLKPDAGPRRRVSEPFDTGTPPLLDAWEAHRPGEPHPPSFCISEQRYGPPHCADYVFLTPDLTRRIETVIYDTETRLSDHQPVAVTLRDD